MNFNRRKNPILILIFSLLWSSVFYAQTAEQKEIIDDAMKAKNAFIEMNPYMEELFESSAGYAIFPNVGEGAYIIGVASGNGAVYQDGQLIGMADLKQVDVGLQFGGKAYSEVIFFKSDAALANFKEGEFSLSGEASAVVLEEGIGESISFKNGIAVVTMPKAGAMVDVSVGGQRFEFQPLE